MKRQEVLKGPLLAMAILTMLAVALGCVLVEDSSSSAPDSQHTYSKNELLCVEGFEGGKSTFIVDGIVYKMKDDGSVSVNGHNGTGVADVVIPSVVSSPDGIERTVTSIDKDAFKKMSELTSVVIPDTVTNIGKNAFKECENLKTLSIPIDVKCNDAFGKVKIESLTLTKGYEGKADKEFWKSWKDDIVTLVVEDGINGFDSSFKNAKKLGFVKLVDVENIGEDQFRGCKELTEFHGPNVRTVGDNAFMDCSKLETVDLSSLESYTRGMFVHCYALTTMLGEKLFIVEKQVFMAIDENRASMIQFVDGDAKDLFMTSEIVSPSGKTYLVDMIGKEAFRNNAELAQIAIPDSVTKIDEHAFHDCKSLKTISVPIDVDCSYSSKKFAFEGVEPTGLTLTKGMAGTMQDEFWESWKDGIVTLVVEEGVKGFDSSFKKAKKLGFVKLVDVENIGEDQFRGCKELTEFHGPNVRTVGDNAFMDCSKLETVDLSSLESYTRGMFVHCYALTTMLGEKLFIVEKQVFMAIDENRASMIQFVDKDAKKYLMPSKVTSPSGKTYLVDMIGKEAFRNNAELDQIAIPDSVNKIDEHAFHDCKSLKTITIPIGIDCSYKSKKFAFEGVKPTILTLTKGHYDPKTYMENEFWKPFRDHLEILTVDAGITDFKTSFKGMDLTTLIMYSVEKIYNEQFEGCEELQTISLYSVTNIGSSAFAKCGSLLAAELPMTQVIGKKAFLKCGHLHVVSAGSTKVIGQEAFRKCAGLKSFQFDNVDRIDKEAFWDTGVKKSSLPKDRDIEYGSRTFGKETDNPFLLIASIVIAALIAVAIWVYRVFFASAPTTGYISFATGGGFVSAVPTGISAASIGSVSTVGSAAATWSLSSILAAIGIGAAVVAIIVLAVVVLYYLYR